MKNYKITVNGNTYDVTVEEGVAQAALTPIAAPIKQGTAPVAQVSRVESPRALVAQVAPVKPVTAPMAASGAQGSVKVNSPMPGKILNVNVSAGQSVKRGEALVVLEAMKMENEIVAPVDGTVASINVSVGVSVEPGDLLVSLN